jgi:hypothetical protein
MDLSRVEFLECGAFSAATTGFFLPSGRDKHFVGLCLPLRNTYPVSATVDTPLTFPGMMQVDCQLPCNCGDGTLLDECRSTSCKSQPPAPQVVVPRRSGQRDQDTTWDLLFHCRRIKPGFLNLREADLPYRLLGICNIFRASALDRMTSCFGRWGRRIMSSKYAIILPNWGGSHERNGIREENQ